MTTTYLRTSSKSHYMYVCYIFVKPSLQMFLKSKQEYCLVKRSYTYFWDTHTHTHTHTYTSSFDNLREKCPCCFPVLLPCSSLALFLLAHICSAWYRQKQVLAMRIPIPGPVVCCLLGLLQWSGFHTEIKKMLLLTPLCPSQL